jgi:hypothetical protein
MLQLHKALIKSHWVYKATMDRIIARLQPRTNVAKSTLVSQGKVSVSMVKTAPMGGFMMGYRDPASSAMPPSGMSMLDWTLKNLEAVSGCFKDTLPADVCGSHVQGSVRKARPTSGRKSKGNAVL